MSDEGRKRPLPIAILIIAALVLLYVGLRMFVPSDEKKKSGGGASTGGNLVGTSAVTNLAAQLSRQDDLSEKSKTLREGETDGSYGPQPLDYSAEKGPEILYPATEEFATSHPLELAMGMERGRLAGWVSDEKVVPIIGAKVSLKYEADVPKSVTLPKLETMSDQTGKFLIEKIPQGRWAVIAEKDGYATDVVTGVDVPSGGQGEPVSLRLVPELVVEGSVVASERPVTTAHVTAFREHLSVQTTGAVSRVEVIYDSSATGEKGEFTLHQLPEAKVTLRVEAPGYATSEKEIQVTAKMPPIILYLEPEALLAGLVRGARGEPVAGAELTLRQPDDKADAKAIAATKSVDQGAFTFTKLPANKEYMLSATAPNYQPAGPIRVLSGTTTNVIVLSSGGAIEGTVTELGTGRPMGGLQVVAEQSSGDKPQAFWSKTMSDGRYHIGRLSAGNYNVAMSSEKLTSEPRNAVEVKTSEATKGIDFAVYPGVDIGGTVEDGDSSERLANATVNLASRAGAGLLIAKKNAATTDGSGAFSFTNLPQGIYELTADLSGYTRGVGEEASVRVEVTRGTTPDPVRLLLYRGGIIDGTVVDSAGSPVSGALVQLFHDSSTPARISLGDFTSTTDNSGSFEFQGIPTHQEVYLRASAWAEGQGKAKSDRMIINRERYRATCQVVLTGGSALEVSVQDTYGSGIEGAKVSLSHNNFPGDASPPAWTKETGGLGTVIFDQIPYGGVRVSASKQGYLGASGGVTMSPEPLERLTLALQPARVMTGRVIDDLGKGIQEGKVTARAESGSTGGGAGSIGSDSSFRIESLGKGTFRLDAEARRSTPTGKHSVTWSFPSVEPNDGTSDVVLTVPFNGSIDGQVVIPDTDVGLPNFTVHLSGQYQDDASINRTFNTQGTFTTKGNFSFVSLPPGTYQLTVTAPNYLPITKGPYDIVSPGNQSVGILMLTAGGSVTFRAINSASGEVISGVTGELTPDGPKGSTGGNGICRIDPVSPRIYDALKLSHGEYRPTQINLVRVSRGRETNLGDIELQPGGVIFGEVTDGVKKPLKGISVEARAVDSDEVKRASTNAGGYFSLSGLKPGGQILSFSGTVNGRRVAKSFETISTPGTENEQNVVLWANSKLRGMLVGPGTVDLGRSIVTLYPMRSDLSPMISEAISVSDVSGNQFVIDNLIDGYYLVAAQAPQGNKLFYWSTWTSVYDQDNYVLVEAGHSVLNGRLLQTSNGPAVSGQDVRLELLTAPQSGVTDLRRWWQWTTTTDADGRYVFQYLPSGTFSFTANNETLQADILEIVTVDHDGAVITKDYSFFDDSGSPKTQSQQSRTIAPTTFDFVNSALQRGTGFRPVTQSQNGSATLGTALGAGQEAVESK